MLEPNTTATDPLVPHEHNAPGKPVAADVVPLCVPVIRGQEWRYLKDCLDTNWVSSAGPYVDRFEHLLAQQTNKRFSVATASGTAALHTALLAMGIEPDDEVLCSTYTFVAPANAIRYCGAWPVFVDAEPQYWQMDPDLLSNFLKKCKVRSQTLINPTSGRVVRAILPVHVLGHPCDMVPIREVAERYELPIIEDAAESLGARYKQDPVGGLGRVGCFSFNGNKLVTCGGGGMLVTDDEQLANTARHLTTQAKTGVDFSHDRVGYNYRLTNIQAALGCAQMEQLESFIQAKREIAQFYAQHLGDLPGIQIMPEAPWAFSTYWMYTILIDSAQFGQEPKMLCQRLRESGIVSQPRWLPLHQTHAHRGCESILSGVAESLHARSLSLPCSVDLGDEQLRQVTTAIRAQGQLSR